MSPTFCGVNQEEKAALASRPISCPDQAESPPYPTPEQEARWELLEQIEKAITDLHRVEEDILSIVDEVENYPDAPADLSTMIYVRGPDDAGLSEIERIVAALRKIKGELEDW